MSIRRQEEVTATLKAIAALLSFEFGHYWWGVAFAGFASIDAAAALYYIHSSLGK